MRIAGQDDEQPAYRILPQNLEVEQGLLGALMLDNRALKAVAKDLNIPVLALSQFSRDVEKREDKRPQLADLCDSGAIKQDADVVRFMYREEYDLSRDEPRQRGEERDEAFLERHASWENRLRDVADIAEVIIAKQRMGPIGVEKLSFNPELTRFTDL